MKKLYKKRKSSVPSQKFEQSPLHVLSHQLRSPVYSIRNALDLLSQYKNNDSYSRNIIRIARRKSTQLINLLEDLLKITDSKVEQISGKRHKAIALDKVIKKVKSIKEFDTKKVINFEDKLKSKKYKFYLHCNKELLEQAFTNILDNALNYSNGKGKVKLKMSFLNSNVEIRVKDQGPGIPLKEQPLIFAPFYRLPTPLNRASKGSGLGLTISKLFIEKMGGSIGVKSTVGKGSEFWIKLPAINDGKKNTYIVGKK